MIKYLCVLSALIVMIGCRPAQKGSVAETVKMPPGQCSITATVLKVDTTLTRNDPESVCARAPCFARIRILRVDGCGAGIAEPVAAGDELTVQFLLTLSPTEKLLPGMSRHYPGLREGASFRAGMSEQQAPGGVNRTISHYEPVAGKR